jgi:hypothetical protein
MALASRRKDIKWGKTSVDGAANPNFNGGQYVDEKGYLRVLKPDHPYQNHGYVYMHRLVMEDLLGRYLESLEAVHHINEIKLDNRVDNLFLTTSAEHSSIHRTGKRKSLEQKTQMRNRVRERRRSSGAKRNAAGQFVKSD